MVELMTLWPGLSRHDFWSMSGLELAAFRHFAEQRKEQ